MNGLAVVNIELTSRCNKSCWMCGRRVIEKMYPESRNMWGDIDFDLLQLIAKQIPEGIVIQFHNNGEPLLYPRLGEALDLFPNNIKCFNTNGKLLLEKADEIIGKVDTLALSVFENDSEGEKQYEIIKEFIKLKSDSAPYLVFRLLGNCQSDLYEKLDGLICTRTLHSPMGSYKYTKTVTKPEIGICLDLLNHLAIDIHGNVSICVRFDPDGCGILGNIEDTSLKDLWYSPKRLDLIKEHVKGNRKANKLCEKCQFYGCPTP